LAKKQQKEVEEEADRIKQSSNLGGRVEELDE